MTTIYYKDLEDVIKLCMQMVTFEKNDPQSSGARYHRVAT